MLCAYVTKTMVSRRIVLIDPNKSISYKFILTAFILLKMFQLYFN